MSYIDILLPDLNYLVRERVDVLFSVAAEFLPEIRPHYLSLSLVVLFVSLWLWYGNLPVWQRGKDTGSDLSFAALLARGTAQAFGLAMVLCFSLVSLSFLSGSRVPGGALHWFPLLTFFAYRLVYFSGAGSALLFFLAALLWVSSNAVFGPFGLLLVLPLVLSLGRESKARLFETGFVWAMTIVAVVSLLSWYFQPTLPMPDYPPGARVVPVSPLLMAEVPRIGDSMLPQSVVFSAWLVDSREAIVRFLLLSASLVLALLPGGRWRGRLLPLLLTLGCFAVFFVPEIYLADSFRNYLPWQTLRRLLPGLGLLEPFSLLFPLLWLALLLRYSGALSQLGKVLALVLVVMCSFSTSDFQPKASIYRQVGSDEALNVHDAGFSPSAWIVSRFGDWLLEDGIGEKRSHLNLARISLRDAIISSATNASAAGLAIDGVKESRWSTGGPQQGGESLLLELSAEATIQLLVLSTAQSPSDFPRGLSVDVSLDGVTWQNVFHQQEWLGPLRWTRKGYPYLGAQGDVVVPLESAARARFLRFTQLGSDTLFDWSVHEIKLFG
ncbi:MAG: discoidin domain-containing protein [bacterium]|nr:discoidin domain-containing protein [bacterium]